MHTYPLVGRLRGYYLADYVESICVRRIVKDGTPPPSCSSCCTQVDTIAACTIACTTVACTVACIIACTIPCTIDQHHIKRQDFEVDDVGNSYSYTHSFIFFVLNFYHEPYYPQRSNFSIVSICQRPEWKQKKRKWRRRVIF